MELSHRATRISEQMFPCAVLGGNKLDTLHEASFSKVLVREVMCRKERSMLLQRQDQGLPAPPAPASRAKSAATLDGLRLGTSSGLFGSRYLIPKALELDGNI